MSSGSFVKMGDKLCSTYPATHDAMYDLCDDFYEGAYNFSKSAGYAGYGQLDGYFNAIMGKKVTIACFACDNAWSAIGAKPYQHEGVRIATDLATYGMGKLPTDSPSDPDWFVGLGGYTEPDGRIPDSVRLEPYEYRERFKDLPFSYDYGMALMALENKDDTIAYNDYTTQMAKNYSDLADKSLLRPVNARMPVVGTWETSLNSLQRVISSYDEYLYLKDTVGMDETAAKNAVCPYGGNAGDFTARVTPRVGETAPDAKLSGQFIDAEGAVLSLEEFDNLYSRCMNYWNSSGSTQGKVWLCSPLANIKVSQAMRANNILLDQVWVQKDFNGVKTIPGREGGILLCQYFNIPIMPDANLNFDFAKKDVSTKNLGDIMLLDLEHIWMSVLTPIEFYTANNVAYLNKLQERNVYEMRAETRIDSFRQSGKITNLATAD